MTTHHLSHASPRHLTCDSIRGAGLPSVQQLLAQLCDDGSSAWGEQPVRFAGVIKHVQCLEGGLRWAGLTSIWLDGCPTQAKHFSHCALDICRSSGSVGPGPTAFLPSLATKSSTVSSRRSNRVAPFFLLVCV